jgi:hypothetical protein
MSCKVSSSELANLEGRSGQITTAQAVIGTMRSVFSEELACHACHASPGAFRPWTECPSAQTLPSMH